MGPKLYCLIVVGRKWNILILATLILSAYKSRSLFLLIISALAIIVIITVPNMSQVKPT